jgi:hypothetical protein
MQINEFKDKLDVFCSNRPEGLGLIVITVDLNADLIVTEQSNVTFQTSMDRNQTSQCLIASLGLMGAKTSLTQLPNA